MFDNSNHPPQALGVIHAIADFVESKNTKGSGSRYALKFKAAIKKLACQTFSILYVLIQFWQIINIHALILGIG